eukprot:9480631-Pyramimonas_sp.AAC.1
MSSGSARSCLLLRCSGRLGAAAASLSAPAGAPAAAPCPLDAAAAAAASNSPTQSAGWLAWAFGGTSPDAAASAAPLKALFHSRAQRLLRRVDPDRAVTASSEQLLIALFQLAHGGALLVQANR